MNKLASKVSLIVVLLFAISCNNGSRKEENQGSVGLHKIQDVWEYSNDSAKARPIPIPKFEGIPAGKPAVFLTDLNIHRAGQPKLVGAGQPKIIRPGSDTFLRPKSIPAITRPLIAGLPDLVVAKDPSNKDQNPDNFSTYGKPQGLKNSIVCSMLQDKNGNLWFGTYGGGVSRYDGKFFTNFTDKEGLSNVEVWCILEDRNGNLWFGTNGGGVSRYDGRSFTNFTDREGLTNNKVFTMLEDRTGKLWFGTKGGVSCYDGKSFTNYTDKTGLSHNTVYSIIEDKEGRLWFGTYGGGVSRYDGQAFTNYGVDQGLSSNQVFSILEDRNGKLWFGTGAGVCCYNGRSFANYTDKEGLSNNEVWSILEDKAGNLWFGTNGGGVSRYDGKSFAWFTDQEGLSNNTVYCILEDKIGNLWFGTYNGGCRYDGKSITNFTVKEGLNNNTVFGIIQDRKGDLWFGTKGGGISRYDGRAITNFTEKEGLSNNEVLSILEDRKGFLWFGTNGGVTRYDGNSFTNFTEKEGLCNNTVLCIREDKSGRIWFGTNGGGLTRYDGKSFTNFTEKEGLSNNTVLSIWTDKNGDLLFGTNRGVSRYDGKSFTHMSNNAELSQLEVWSILRDKSGHLWFGTNGAGVWCYDNDAFIQLTEKDGLSNNTVWSILEDKRGDLWFGTRFGLCELTGEKLAILLDKAGSRTAKGSDVFFKNYSYADGFLGIGVNSGQTIYEAVNGTIWIATNDRLTAYNPSQRENQADTTAPNIQLIAIELFNENIAWGNLNKNRDTNIKLGNGVRVGGFEFDSLTRWYNLPENLSLAYNNNYLTFNYIGITMNQSRSVKYQYMLEGLDDNWSALTNRTSAPYGNLPHGTYTFKVKAMNSQGYWSPNFEYTFTIRPPWWETWWFRSLAVLLVIVSIWYYIKSRERKLRAEKDTLEQTVKARTAQVVEQKHLIEQKHKEIKDSIHYAERIQRSFLATKELLDENLHPGNYFVFFEPKDVVSGDFYWASKLSNGNFVLATSDSTGHGVPGAIMSILNISCLNETVKEGFVEPSDILNQTRTKIIDVLKKDGSPEGGKDGMDCSVISFDFKNSRLTYAAANNPVWIVRYLRSSKTLSLLEFPSDKMPVGKHDKDNLPFNQHTIDLQKGDVIYTLTDGLSDQFGGSKGKKFMYKRLKELLVSISKLSMHQQKESLARALNEWKGDMEQVDDVCIIGIRI